MFRESNKVSWEFSYLSIWCKIRRSMWHLSVKRLFLNYIILPRTYSAISNKIAFQMRLISYSWIVNISSLEVLSKFYSTRLEKTRLKVNSVLDREPMLSIYNHVNFFKSFQIYPNFFKFVSFPYLSHWARYNVKCSEKMDGLFLFNLEWYWFIFRFL